MVAPRVRVLGPDVAGGAYILRLEVRSGTAVAFGRHARGAPVPVAAGSYAYVGSALGESGRPLATRLLRHATRAAGPCHDIWPEIARCRALLLGADPPEAPRPKRLRWHVDYLLESPAVTLAAVVAVRSSTRIERELAACLEDAPETSPLSPGLGAGDDPGRTHLLRLEPRPTGRPASPSKQGAPRES